MFDILLRPTPLHIPDGFLSVGISLLFWGISLIILWVAIRKTSGEYEERQIPLMGVMAAFVFAAQMINFPVVGGTSGHMLGGALVAIALGPWAGMLVMASVITVQALLFQDGGLLVLGTNIFNMGIVTSTIGFGVYHLVAAKNPKTRLIFAGIAAWFSVLASSFFTSGQLWLSGTTSLRIVFPAMMGIHAVIGLGEALITFAALSFILRTRPDILNPSQTQQSGRGWVAVGLAISFLIVFITPFASSNPDGLERVAMDLGFAETAQNASLQILPDYTIPFLGDGNLSTLAAGILGVIVVAVVAWGLLFLRRQTTSAS
ncbi:MAG: cobalamin biosynthesis protein CbiM [Anaerolineae bacterium]|nr:cobalamin biosynthesis protein CbiM [Anaerolineae bacterium]